MTKLSLVRAWGCDLPRLPPEFDTVVLTDDPAAAWVLGNVEGTGRLRRVDVRTGATLREHVLPEFARVPGRVVASRASRDGAVLAAFVDGDGAAVRALSLDDGATRPVVTLPWRPLSVERVDGDPRLLLDGGTLVDPATGVSDGDGVRRWRSRDLRFECVEERRPRKDHPHVKLHLRTPAATLVSHVTLGDGRAAVFSRDGRYFWRRGLSLWGGFEGFEDYQSRWDLADGGVEELYRAPRDAWYAATRDDGGAPLLCGRGGEVVDETCLADAARACARWTAEAACVSPDGARFGRVLEGLVRVTDLTSGLANSYGGHAGRVRSIAPSPDGAWVAVGGHDGDITVWDVATGEERWHLEGSDGPVDALTPSPDGRTLYALVEHAARDGRAQLRAWDLRDGVELTLAPLTYAARSQVTVSPDGSRALVSQGPAGAAQAPTWVDLARWRDRALRAIDVTGVPPKRGAGPMVTGTGAFSEDSAEIGLRCVVGLTLGDVWNVTLDARDGAIAQARREGRYLEVAVDPVVRGGPASAWVNASGLHVRRRDGAPAAQATTTAPVTALALTPDGGRLFAGMADGGVAVWAIADEGAG